MAANSKIQWTDHTHNHWYGCEAVSPACANCYAESWAERFGKDFETRTLSSESNRRKPIKWNAEHDKFFAEHDRRQRVFSLSLGDVFDNKAPAEWRADLFALIRATPNLDWLLLTKRIGNAKHMLPADWGDGYPNVWLGATIANQEEADRDIPKLLATRARVRFLSCEPLLGRIDLSDFIAYGGRARGLGGFNCGGQYLMPPQYISWVICGGESGPHARPMHPDWARSLRDQCVSEGVPFFFKQWGEYLPTLQIDHKPDAPTVNLDSDALLTVYRLGKNKSGRILDGRTWGEFPI